VDLSTLIFIPKDFICCMTFSTLPFGISTPFVKQFEQRSITHSLVLQYNYIFNQFTFKTRLNYTYDFWRSGTNELLGHGLYDNNYIGLSEF
jgi:hypothetical protein